MDIELYLILKLDWNNNNHMRYRIMKFKVTINCRDWMIIVFNFDFWNHCWWNDVFEVVIIWCGMYVIISTCSKIWMHYVPYS